jgi:Protein kinase domain
MDAQYEKFCLADPIFYDVPPCPESTEASFLSGRTVSGGWLALYREPWTIMVPPDSALAQQGWKIHVSATAARASEALDHVWTYCMPRGIPFKFLSDRSGLTLSNAKYADRSGSGKFVTIYPRTDDELEYTLRQLGTALDGLSGPYVLSDARWGDGPLHVRYGGFAEKYCVAADCELVLAIADPTGRLVPDLRGPSFVLPPWVEVPAFLRECVAARLDSSPPPNFPFRIESPLHFSNSGGIYLATDTRDGRRVVLKEARPFAGVDALGRDAVQRLKHERDVLAKLSGCCIVPELYDYITCWEHHFLVEEYVEGDVLGREFISRFPLSQHNADDEAVAGYARWALDVLHQVRHGIHELHAAGIVFGDLHPHNVIVQPDGRVRFIDLEFSSYLEDNAAAVQGAHGYMPPDGRTGADVDHYALACLLFGLFLPLNRLFRLDPVKARTLAELVVRRFPIPRPLVAGAVETLCDRRASMAPGGERDMDPARRVSDLAAEVDAGRPDWLALRASMREAILASATLGRADRLFPGDIEQFSRNGVGLAYGAAGVLYALARAGAGRFPEHERWLLDSVRDGGHRGLVGFYDGLHGVAYALAELGLRDEALAVLERAMGTPPDSVPASLFGGLAGIGLNLLHFAAITGDASFEARAVAAGTLLADRSASGAGGRAGLMYGRAGHALLYLRLFETTGDKRFLGLAEASLRHDLSRCLVQPDGTMLVDEGWRAMPYVATGSTGIGLVLSEYLRHRPQDEFATALARIRRAAESEFVVGSGLFNGRAGLVLFLSSLRTNDSTERSGLRAVIGRHLQRLAWHVIPYKGHVAFPGDRLMRLAMDLATGSAGVLIALSAALDGNSSALPFFPWQSTRVEGGDLCGIRAEPAVAGSTPARG